MSLLSLCLSLKKKNTAEKKSLHALVVSAKLISTNILLRSIYQKKTNMGDFCNCIKGVTMSDEIPKTCCDCSAKGGMFFNFFFLFSFTSRFRDSNLRKFKKLLKKKILHRNLFHSLSMIICSYVYFS